MRKVRRGVCKHCRHEIEERAVRDDGGTEWLHLSGINTGRVACDPDMQSTLADPLGGGREVEEETPPHDPVAAALFAVLEVLAPLDPPTRGRILRAVCIFYGVAV